MLLICRSASAQLQMLLLLPQLPLALVEELVSQLAVVASEAGSVVVLLVATVRQPATSVEDQITLLAIARRRP